MVSQKYRWDFIGLSTDTKPTSETSEKVVNGSTYYCSDTSKLYVYCNGTWYERKPLGSGGGTSDFNDLSNRPKYNGSDMTGSTNIPEVVTYSDFTGTDGTVAGTAGLVPAPTTTDAGKFLKADGTWDTAGSAINVVQSTGTSTTDVMSQNAVTSMVFADPASRNKLQLGKDAVNMGANSGVAIGQDAFVASGTTDALAVGRNAAARATNSVAIGAQSNATAQGEMSIGNSTRTDLYNNTGYRLLTGLYDGQNAHDAVTKGQLDSIAIQNAGAPTTATVGTVGQLLEVTTNGKLYICTDATNPYVWEEVGAGGGGSGPTVVQTTGTSTTDVMSQNATTSMVFADSSTKYRVQIGASSSNQGRFGVAIGCSARVTSGGEDGVAIGYQAQSQGSGQISIGVASGSGPEAEGISIGTNSKAYGRGSVAIGSNSGATNLAQGQFDIGSRNTSYGYNNSNYRLLTGLYDPQSDHDAATKGYVDPTTDSSAPTTATVGRLGQIQIDTTNADAYMCVAVDSVTPSYTWKKITA